MGATVKIEDFKGRYTLSKTLYGVDDIQASIDDYTPVALAELLGGEMSTDFIANLDAQGVPVLPEYQTIFNAMTFDGDPAQCGCKNGLFYSRGIKAYLLGYIYFKHISEGRITPTPTGGFTQNKNENSTSLPAPTSEIYNRYNESLYTLYAIQEYIRRNRETYPVFRGKHLLLSYSL